MMTEQTLSAAAEPLVLGIESSCDETGIGIVRGTRLLTNTVSSSMEEHVRFGGVIPEIASRAHLDAMIPALEAALADAHVTLDDIDAIAVTAGPGALGVPAASGATSVPGAPSALSALVGRDRRVSCTLRHTIPLSYLEVLHI